MLSGFWLQEKELLSTALVAGLLQLLLESNSQPFAALGAKLAHNIANKMISLKSKEQKLPNSDLWLPLHSCSVISFFCPGSEEGPIIIFQAFLAELEQNSGKIQKVKEELSGLLEKYPDSPEVANWKKMQEDLSKCLKHHHIRSGSGLQGHSKVTAEQSRF